jgi:hypothetical protein
MYFSHTPLGFVSKMSCISGAVALTVIKCSFSLSKSVGVIVVAKSSLSKVGLGYSFQLFPQRENCETRRWSSGVEEMGLQQGAAALISATSDIFTREA